MFSNTQNSCTSPRTYVIRFQPILFFYFLLSITQPGFAQYEGSEYTHKSRFGIQYGHGAKAMPWTDLDIEYHYEVNLLQLQYFHAIKTGRTFACDLLVAPQFNTTTYREVDQIGDFYNGYEVGLTAGISPRVYSSNRTFGFYLLITTGPMYISGTPGRQAEGLNFSSMGATGIQLRVMKKTYIDLRTGFRHLSNAHMKEPNGGVNNLVWSVGVNYAL